MSWRQHRLALAGVLVVLGGVGLMLFNGLAMHHAYTRLGLDTCGKLSGPSCQSQLTIFRQDYGSWADHLPTLLMVLPGLIGVFVGAPLVARELESGTFRFAWTQSRSRVQWIVTKLVLLGVLLTALALAFSALFTWWYGPFDAITGRMANSGAYEISGLVFAARTLFGYLTAHHDSQWVSFQPNGWFWHFQIIEASGYVVLAILLAVATVLVLRRRAV